MELARTAPGWVRFKQRYALFYSSDMYRATNPASISKYPQIAVKFGRTTRRLLRIVRELYGWMAVDRRHLANDGDRIKIGGAIRRASHEVISQIGAPAETDADAAGKMTIGFFDRSDIHAV